MRKNTATLINARCQVAFACGQSWAIRQAVDAYGIPPPSPVVVAQLSTVQREAFDFLLPGTWWLYWRRGWERGMQLAGVIQ
jgi:hypothetical protein